ncbi:flippase [Methanocella conradii]|uniref:flippase n=1 Tax=Methanocella conradii TaxID=1175444 RepID=UPI00157C24A8|nr:flippase [Methanocella conradii]
MSQERKIAGNVLSMVISVMLPNVIALAQSIIVANVLLTKGMSAYITALSFSSLFLTLSDLGMSTVFIRSAAKDHEKSCRLFGTFFSTRLVIVSALTLIAVVAGQFMPYTPDVKFYILIISISLLINQMAQSFGALFQAHERMVNVAACSILQACVFFVTSVALVISGYGVIGLVSANLISSVAMLAVYTYLGRWCLPEMLSGVDRKKAVSLLKTSLPFTVGLICYVVYTNIDRIILSVYHYDEVANYGVPMSLIMSLTFISSAYSAAVFPVFSRMNEKGDVLKYACEKSLKYLMAIILPMCVGVMLLSDRIIYTIYNPDYAGAIPVMSLLVWLLAFSAISTLCSNLLNATGRERATMAILVICVIAVVVLDLLLIPPFGAIGACIATLAATGALNAALSMYAIRDYLVRIRVGDVLLRPAAAAIVMAAFILAAPLGNLFFYVVAGVIVYFTAYIVMGGLSRDDVDIARRVLGR